MSRPRSTSTSAWTSLRSRAAAFSVVLMIAIVPSTASAIGCRDWQRMNENQKWGTIDRMIEQAISGQGGRSYRVNRESIRRCLQSHAESMFYAFEDTCADSRSADMRAIDRIFKNYIWDCVG